MKKVLHIISHTHWDREWYMSFEQHRMRLVELMDTLIETMEREEEYKYFHLDGQTIVIDDYLEIRPQMRDRLFKLINDGRIQVGPWYILQDEFLTSGEANVRNMMEGLRYCEENGIEPVMTGYMPDAFGNISQMPQILRGFGIDNAVFGRGIDEVFADNKPSDASNSGKELNWYGADGSKVMGIMFSKWYDNANELPVEDGKVEKVYRNLVDNISAYMQTPNLLAMNGCDHQPVQCNLPTSIAKAKEFFGDEIEIRHSNFKDFIESMRPYADNFKSVEGELVGQHTSGYGQLVGTASTHIPNKQKNHKAQNILTQKSEPISVISNIFGDAYRSDMMRYAWKKLMQCHPHDSICCCSCDEVTNELSIRLDKATQTAEYISAEAAEFIADNLDTSNIKGKTAIVVINTDPKQISRAIKTKIYLDDYVQPKSLVIRDIQGKIVPSSVNYVGKKFTYTLPKDSFRKKAYKHCYDVSFYSELSGVGCFAYGVDILENSEFSDCGLTVFENGAENKFIKLTIAQDGTLTVLDKITGQEYSGLNRYEDSGDCGNSYDYKETADFKRVYSTENAKIKLIDNNGLSAIFEIVTVLDIPKGLNGGNRTEEIEPHIVTTTITLNAFSSRVDIKTQFKNKSENHRLRALFDSCIETDTVLADGQFDVVRRPISQWEGWTNPSNCQRMQAFFGLENAECGLLVAARGLNEYEILRDGKNTMALTLLRSVGEMGDWGIFPTPDLQLVDKTMVLEYALVPYSLVNRDIAFDNAYSFAGDFVTTVQTSIHNGIIKPNDDFISVNGKYIRYSALKKAETSDNYILRIYNVSNEKQETEIIVDNTIFKNAYLTNLAENQMEKLNFENGIISLELTPKKIKTLMLEI